MIGIKIDAQGYEQQILSRGDAALARAAYLELELSPEPLYDGESPMLSVIQRLEERGFVLVGAENEWSDPKTGRALQLNGLFIRR